MTALDTTERVPRREPDTRRDFHRYLWGSGTSTFGTMFTGVATSALAVNTFHVSGIGAGVLRMAGTLPVLLIAPVAGTMVDRLPWPRRVLIAAELCAAAAVGLFALGLAAGVTSFALLLALTAVLGATTTVAASAFFTHLNSLRPRHLAQARAKMQTVDSVVGVGASAGAGPLIAAFGPLVALVTDAVSYLLSAGALRSISAPDHNPARDPGSAATPIRRDLAEGVQVLLRSRLRPIVGYMLLAQAAFTGVAALKAIFILRTLDIPLYLYGVPAIGAMAFGVLGSVLAGRMIGAGRSPGRCTLGWWLGSAVSLLILPAAAGPLPALLGTATLSLSVMSLCGSAANITLVALFSESVPERAMGRVNASLMVLGSLATLIGAPVAGEVADLLGVRTALLLCGLASLAGLPLLRSWWRQPPAPPGADQPRTDQPGTDQPGTDQPRTDQPRTAPPARPG
jgi:MFS family permease